MTGVCTRRAFLRSASLGLGAVALTPWARARTPEALIGAAPPDAEALKAVAHRALEAARAAGADFADLRILTGLRMKWEPPPHAVASARAADLEAGIGQPILLQGARIGIRAWANGQMGFAGNILSFDPDQIAALAGLAVRRAQAWPKTSRPPVALAPAPRAEGFWETPVERDPFAVPLGEQESLLLDAMEAARSFTTSGWMSLDLAMEWKRVDELFASTEGSLIRQRIFTANHTGGLWARPDPEAFAFLAMNPGNLGGTRGYEALANLRPALEAMLREAEEIRSRPWREVDSGAHELVLGARAAAQLVAATIGAPLELDRALRRADAAKDRAVSYAMPPAEALGAFEVGNALLNVSADRSRPGLAATVGWDAEGVKPEDFTLIRGGILADYLSDRATAGELAETYARLGKPLRSNGCAADGGGLAPRIKPPNLTLEPGAEDLSEEDLIRDLKRGYFIDDLSPSLDHAGLNVQARGMHVRRIEDGRKTDVVMNATLQFNTPRFWKSLQALGGAQSLRVHHEQIDEESIEKLSHVGLVAPPIRMGRVNLVNTGRRGRRSD